MHIHKTIPLEHVDSGKYIGKICYICERIFTPSTKDSFDTLALSLKPNKSHAARVDAATKLGFKIKNG